MSALGVTWYFYGTNNPAMVIAADTAPRVLFSALAAGALLLGAPLFTVGLAIAAQAATGLGLTLWNARVSRDLLRGSFGRGLSALKSQRVLAVGRIVSLSYTYLPVVVIQMLAPGAVASFAALDRVMRMGLAVAAAVPNRFQSWIGSSSTEDRVRRCRTSFTINAALGLLAGITFYVVATFASAFLFSGQIDLSAELIVLFAAIAAIICASRGAGLWLVGVGRANHITGSVIAAALVGIPSIAVLTHIGGTASFAAAGVLIAEVVGLLVQLRGTRKTEG